MFIDHSYRVILVLIEIRLYWQRELCESIKFEILSFDFNFFNMIFSNTIGISSTKFQSRIEIRRHQYIGKHLPEQNYLPFLNVQRVISFGTTLSGLMNLRL